MELEQVVSNEETFSPAAEVVSADMAVPPEVPAASEEVDQEIAEIQEAIDAAQSDEEKAAHKSKLNSAFARLRREKREAKAAEIEALKEAAYQRGLAEARKGAAPESPAKPIVPETPVTEFTKPAPNEDDFEEYSAYQEAREEWLLEKAEHRVKARIEADQQRRQQEVAQTETAKWAEKGKERYPDFEEVIASHAQNIPPVMAAAVKSAENSHDIAYHLGKNPTEYARIAGLEPVQQAIEIGRIAERMKSAPPKRQTSAPPPITPVKGGGVVSHKDPADMNTEEYIAYMNQREFGKGG